MKKGPFNIYIDRLKNDDTETIFESVEPSVVLLTDTNLSFPEKVIVSGQAYLAKNHLILDLKINTKVSLPCSICNEQTVIAIHIDDFSQTQEISEVKSAIYDYTEEIRTAILLKIPQFVECHEGKCPGRKETSKYFKQVEPDTHTPFSNLELQ